MYQNEPHNEVYCSQSTPEKYLEIEYIQYDNEGEVFTWRVNWTDQDSGHTTKHSWDCFEDAEWFFNEYKDQYVNVEY